MQLDLIRVSGLVKVKLEESPIMWSAEVLKVDPQRHPRSVHIRLMSLRTDLWVAPEEILEEV